jgi:hypothetical protein
MIQSMKIKHNLARQGKPALNIDMSAYMKMSVGNLANKSIRQLKEFIRDRREKRIDETIVMLEAIKHKLEDCQCGK